MIFHLVFVYFSELDLADQDNEPWNHPWQDTWTIDHDEDVAGTLVEERQDKV